MNIGIDMKIPLLRCFAIGKKRGNLGIFLKLKNLGLVWHMRLGLGLGQIILIPYL